MSKPQCQFCDEHGKRDKASPPPAPTVTSIPPPSESLRITAPGLDPITALLFLLCRSLPWR